MEQTAVNSGLLPYTPSPALAQFLETNAEFMEAQYNASLSLPSLDPQRIYWYHVNLVNVQLNGIYQGYQEARHGTILLNHFHSQSNPMKSIQHAFGRAH